MEAWPRASDIRLRESPGSPGIEIQFGQRVLCLGGAAFFSELALHGDRLLESVARIVEFGLLRKNFALFKKA
jgi:hypothetical protein